MLQEHADLEIDCRNGPPLSREELIESVRDVHAIVPVIPDVIDEDIINAGKNLKIIAAFSVGYDHIDTYAAEKKGIYVSNTPGDLTQSVAEHTIALMTAVGRNIVQADKYIRKGEYEFWDPMLFLGTTFIGKTLGVVGFGRIGQYVAEMCQKGFGMRIVYNSRFKKPSSGASFLSLDELLEISDVVSLNCSLTEETRHLIDEPELKKMKPTSLLINTSRGPVINEKSLIRALREKWIAGAGLDVFEDEPKIPEELINLDNVVLTPHIASATKEARIQMARMVAENIIKVLIKGQEPIHKI